MLELLVLGFVMAVGVALFAGVVVVLTVVKLILRLVLLPLLLIKWLVFGVLFSIVGPILFLVGLLLAFIMGAAVLLPLLPFIAVAFLVYLLSRRSDRPVVA